MYTADLSSLRGTVVERRSLAGELPLSCARPAPDGCYCEYEPSTLGQPTRPTQPFILLGSIDRVPALIGLANVTSARWQVTLCDPIWHVREFP